MLIQEELHSHEHRQNRFAVIPTTEKLNAKKEFTGKDVTIAFLDSGFYPHPDYSDRVVSFVDISCEETEFGKNSQPNGFHWHGTQTIVSCAGDGSLSDGVYSGLASQANLVLVKVSRNGGSIPDENIEKGLEWVLNNHQQFGIRIVNMSLGGDCDFTTDDSKINQLAEKLVQQGVFITVAAGNSAESRSIPPASAPSVMTVGGYSDENRFLAEDFDLYHSSFGETADGLIKPEIIAPAMFVAAPILPDTTLYKSAEALSVLATKPDYCFRKLLNESWEIAGLPESALTAENSVVRQIIEEKLANQKIVATHYQHVDGTSFAAPIVASVVAQMLEANPNLTPAIIKNILISTASRLAGFPAIRQGFGILNAKLAVEEAIRETHFLTHENYSPPRIEGKKIVFSYHDDAAETVFLVGDFNDWREGEIGFAKNSEGVWIAEIPCQPSGKYSYKYFVNNDHWTEDTSHGLKEEDGFGGFNSILFVE